MEETPFPLKWEILLILGIFAVFEIYILARFELNKKKLYIYLSHFVKFGTWNFPILMEMVLRLHSKQGMNILNTTSCLLDLLMPQPSSNI
jgi:hypothetical protein